MLKRIKRKIIDLFFKIFNHLIKYRVCLFVFNFIYERLSFRWVNFIAHHVSIPTIDFKWSIRLPNGKNVITLTNSNRKTWEFALSYRANDPALNILEVILDNHYAKEIPWIDVGANLGIRSLTALSSHRSVYFIEPNNELNTINRARCELNQFSNYTFFPYGASDIDGELRFYIDSSSYLSSLDKSVIDPSMIIKEEVIPVRMLDSLFEKEMGLLKSAMIKIDTEGHEKNVLAGANKLIDKLSPTLFIEINEKGAHLSSIMISLNEKGYTVYGICYKSETQFLVKMNYESVYDDTFLVFNFLFTKDKVLVNLLDSYLYTI